MRWTTFAVMACCGPAVAGDVWTVDNAGADFTQIQPAVDAAANGDTVLVGYGTYEPFRIVHKGVTVVADTGALVQVLGGIEVRDTLGNHEVVLVGLKSRGVMYYNGSQLVVVPALEVDTTRGPVRVERCELIGAAGIDAGEGAPGGTAVRISIGIDVAFQACTVTGGEPETTYDGFESSRGGDGLRMQGGSLALYDCTIQGMRGADSTGFDCLCKGGNGGDGARIKEDPLIGDTTLFLAGTSIRGGDGGIGDQLSQGNCWDLCGNGGDGLILMGATTAGHFLEWELLGGIGGCHECGTSYDGNDGQPLILNSGASANTIGGEARSFASPSPVRESTTATLTFEGMPNDLVFLLYGATPGFQLLLPWNGVLLLKAPGLMGYRFMGQIGGSGSLSASFAVPTLAATVESSVLYMQGLHRDPTTRRWLGGHSAMVILDQSF